MKVRKLIEALACLPQDLDVQVRDVLGDCSWLDSAEVVILDDSNEDDIKRAVRLES